MSLLDDLYTASIDSVTLESYLDTNFQEIYDYFTWRTDEELNGHLGPLKNFITRNRTIFLGMATTSNNLSFLALLLEVSERLSLEGPFSYLYKYLVRKDYKVGARIYASSKFLIDTDTAEDYNNRFEEIYGTLESAVKDELDNADKALTTIVNYYLKAIADFGKYHIQLAHTIHKNISQKLSANEASFLNRPLIWDLLRTDLSDHEAAESHIRQLLDQFLQRGIEAGERIEGFLLESGTSYTYELEDVNSSFIHIRGIAARHFPLVPKEVFESLHRGVQVITNESQLYVYMYSYGQMHFRKLYEGFECLPSAIFEHPLDIIDWGCGQGMATMVLLEYLADHAIELGNTNALLIEPSSLALQRASLHVKKFDPKINIATINKDLDSLVLNDFKDLHATQHLHFFSNILDIDFFSLSQLVSLIKNRFKGKNYFVILSPYVNDIKKNRLDRFVNSFAANKDFNLMSSRENISGTWERSWTRIERVFVTDII